MATQKARRKAVAAVAAAGVVVALGVTGTTAHAASTPSVAKQPVTAEKVSSQLGAKSGGYFLDKNRRPVVNVLSQSDAAKVRAAGLTPSVVKYSYASLTATKKALDGVGFVKYSSWGIDPSTDQVVVTVSDATPKAAASKLQAAAKRYGSQVRVEYSTSKPEEFVLDGDAIQNDQARCSAGFNVKQGGNLMVLTAGHCTNLGGTWSPMGGTVTESNSPGGDEGLITNPSGDGPSQVNDGTTISSVGSPTVGESVTKSGSTTGVTSGTISAVDQPVNFDVGPIEHLVATDVHSDHGDSGGPAYDGSKALGTLTGGDTQTTFFYPAQIEFSDFGLSLP